MQSDLSLNDAFRFSRSNPPNEEQFRAIGQQMVRELSRALGCDLLVLHEHIEPNSWVTTEICYGERSNDFYLGIVAFSCDRQRVDSVLRKFSAGRRVRDGRKSILTSTYTKSGWEEFVWADDEFDEWECEHLDEIAILRK